MPKYEFVIAVKDEPEAHRKKEGDVVAVRPYPWNWGRKEIDEYLIVMVESDDDLSTMRKRFEVRLYEDGLDQRSLPVGSEKPPSPIAKNRYRIPLDTIKQGWMPALDFAKVRDKTYIYQPLKAASQLVAKFDGKNGNHLLTKKDVDTANPSETEHFIDMSEKVAIIYDKHKKSFKYKKVKVYGDK